MDKELGFVEGLMMILEKFSENLSVEKLIEQDMMGEMLEVLKKLNSVKFLIHKHEFLEIIYKKLHCSYCLENPVSTLLKCQHNLCVDCTDNLVGLQRSSSELLACPLCQDTFLSYTRANSLQKCYSCEYYLPKNCFYSNTLIKYCKTCIAFLIFKNSIQHCKEFSKGHKLLSEVETCEKCEKIVTVKHANFLCKVHVYCYSCFKVGLSRQKCFSCDKKISEEFFEDCKKMMTLICWFCNIQKERVFFVEKNCCRGNICVACQVKFDLKACRKCSTRIDLTQNIDT